MPKLEVREFESEIDLESLIEQKDLLLQEATIGRESDN